MHSDQAATNVNRSSYEFLSDIALLGKLIGVKETKKYYRGTLASVFNPTQSGNKRPEQCEVARELIKRWLSEKLRHGDMLNAPDTVRDYLRIHFSGREYESFVAIFLDTQHQVISVDELFQGTLSQTSVYPREVVKAALYHNAAAVIFSHNHPSGIAEPSKSDDMLTQALKQALALIDVRVLDHFIVAGSTTLSFAERGLI